MKKNNLKKVMAIMLCVMSMGSVGTVSQAKENVRRMSDSGIAPAYVAISSTYTNLSINSDGSLNCDGNTSVWSNYAGIVAELQQYDGGWNTIKTWSNYAADYAAVDNNWFVANGYSYRLKTTHYSYDSNWNQLESVVKYSKTISK